MQPLHFSLAGPLAFALSPTSLSAHTVSVSTAAFVRVSQLQPDFPWPFSPSFLSHDVSVLWARGFMAEGLQPHKEIRTELETLHKKRTQFS